MTQAEVYQALLDIDAFYTSPAGLQRPLGMVRGDGRADLEAVGQWVYQLLTGHSLDDVLAQIRQSEEYRTKHAGEIAAPRYDFSRCIVAPGADLVRCVYAVLQPPRTIEGAFTVTTHVAWLLREFGFGLLRKDAGENVARWHGIGFAAARLVQPDGHLYKILTDVPNGGPSWQDEGIDPKLALLRIAPLDPSQ